MGSSALSVETLNVVLITREERHRVKRHECWGSCLNTTDTLLELSKSFSVPFPSTFLHGIEVSPAANGDFYFKLPDISGNEGGL